LNGHLLDIAHRVATPEGIELRLPLAGPVPRALAWLIDLLLRLGIFTIVSGVSALLGAELNAAVLILLAFFLEWFYPVVCEAHLGGATPGKRAFGLQVLHDDGTPVGWSASLIRNLLRAIDFLPFLYGLGLCSMLANRDFKRLGDLAAGTVVVYREDRRRAHAVPQMPALAPAVPFALDEQRAIVDFAERAGGLTAERAEELAELVAPLLGDDRRTSAAERLIRIANHLVGRRP